MNMRLRKRRTVVAAIGMVALSFLDIGIVAVKSLPTFIHHLRSYPNHMNKVGDFVEYLIGTTIGQIFILIPLVGLIFIWTCIQETMPRSPQKRRRKSAQRIRPTNRTNPIMHPPYYCEC